jgi:hypothetical protein
MGQSHRFLFVTEVVSQLDHLIDVLRKLDERTVTLALWIACDVQHSLAKPSAKGLDPRIVDLAGVPGVANGFHGRRQRRPSDHGVALKEFARAP